MGRARGDSGGGRNRAGRRSRCTTAGERLCGARARLRRHRGPGAGDRRVARQRVGPRRRAEHAVVDGQQRQQHLDALQRRRREAGTVGERSRIAERGGVQRRRDRLRRQLERQERSRAVPVLDRGREDPGLEPGGRRDDGRAGRRTDPPAVRSTRGSRRSPTGCMRPTSTTAGSTSSTRASRRSRSPGRSRTRRSRRASLPSASRRSPATSS
jgi:hypothetical protein